MPDNKNDTVSKMKIVNLMCLLLICNYTAMPVTWSVF
jgi:hypothetical protein